MSCEKEILIFNWMDIKNPNSGGQEKYCYEIGKRLSKDGYKVRWITSKYKDSKANEYIDGIEVIRVGNIFTVYLFGLLKYLKFRKADFVFLSINSIPFIAPFHHKRRLVMIHHRIEPKIMREKVGPYWIIPYLFQEYLNPFIFKLDKIITNSDSTAMDLKSMGYPDASVVKLGVDLPNELPAAKEKIVVSPGPVKPWKHHDWAIEAFSYLDDSWEMIIFGTVESDEYMEYLQSMVQSLHLSTRVKIAGRITEEEVAKILAISSICVLATEKEGWGLVAMEAQSNGCPVIGFDVQGIRDSVIDGETGILVTFSDVVAMGLELRGLAENQEKWRKMSEQAIIRSLDYDWDTCYKEFLSSLPNSKS